MKKILLLITFGTSLDVAAQSNLDTYINAALSSNETIKQQQILVSKSLYALKEAKSLFLPSIAFNGSYTIADGGRTIDFPVGDLLNPAYKSLNQLSGSNNFPEIRNESILLNPDNFYDAKIRTTYPILNADIEYNRRIKKQQYSLQQIETDLYKRELISEVKTAYYRYLQACEEVNIYQAALLVARENSRVIMSLFKNDKINRTAVVRSDNEVSKYNALLESSRQGRYNAAAYFNFLINADLNNDIAADSIVSLPTGNILTDSSVDKREEILKIKEALGINANVTHLAKSYKLPKVNSFVDLGTQAFNFEVNIKTLYYLAGISLEWNIFSGKKNKYRIRQAESDGEVLQSQSNYIKQQLKLQLTTSSNLFKAAIQAYKAAAFQVTSSEKYYADIFRLYREGQALYIELLDAQNQLLTSKLKRNVSLFETWIKATDIERANAGYNLK